MTEPHRGFGEYRGGAGTLVVDGTWPAAPDGRVITLTQDEFAALAR